MRLSATAEEDIVCVSELLEMYCYAVGIFFLGLFALFLHVHSHRYRSI